MLVRLFHALESLRKHHSVAHTPFVVGFLRSDHTCRDVVSSGLDFVAGCLSCCFCDPLFVFFNICVEISFNLARELLVIVFLTTVALLGRVAVYLSCLRILRVPQFLLSLLTVCKLFQNTSVHPNIFIFIDHWLRFHMMWLIGYLRLWRQFRPNDWNFLLVWSVGEVVVLKCILSRLDGAMSQLVTFSSVVLGFGLFLEMAGCCLLCRGCFKRLSTWSESEHLLRIVVSAFRFVDMVVVGWAPMTAHDSWVGVLVSLVCVIHHDVPIRTSHP